MSRSGYYEWKRKAFAREKKKADRDGLVESIRKIREESRKSYGSPRILRVLQSDQYTSHFYQQKLWASGIIGSMSRKGNCWDNAPMKSFFGTLKNECVYARKKYRTKEEAKTDIFRYIEIFYNRNRLHSGLGYKTPESYEKERLQA
ncbi:hypothetical protein MASR2M79_08280 [Aminivibrio sp.]